VLLSTSTESHGSESERGQRELSFLVGLQISIRESDGVTIVDLKGKATIGDDNDLLNSKSAKAGRQRCAQSVAQSSGPDPSG